VPWIYVQDKMPTAKDSAVLAVQARRGKKLLAEAARKGFETTLF